MSVKKTTSIDLERIITSVPGFVYWKNKKGQYLGCNEATATLLGISKEDIIGHDDYFLAEKLGWSKSIVDAIRAVDERVMNTGNAILDIEEVPFPDKNGNIIQQITNKVPLRDAKGNVVGVIGNSVNITQRKKLEEELQQTKLAEEVSKARRLLNLANLQKEVAGLTTAYDNVEDYIESIRYYLESIIACMPGNVYWMDTNSVYLGCNDNVAKMLGMKSRKEIVGKTYEDMMTLVNWNQGQGEVFRKSDQEVIATGEPKLNIEEPPIQDAAGNVVYFLTSRVPIKNNSNQVIGVVGISIDITERKKMEQDLHKAKIAEAANQAKSVFIANMSHDVRTPISGVIGIAGILEKEGSTPKEREYGRIIHSSSEHLLALLNDILEIISADEIREEEIKLTTFNLKERVQHIAELFFANIQTKHIKLETHVDPNLPEYIISDRIKIDRVLLNLVGNGLKFTEQGYVRLDAKLISLNKKEVTFQLSVSDTGVGIPPDKVDKIFDLFYKVSPSYEAKHTGYGIGLFLVNKFVKLLDGDIKVKSELGKGTVFTVTLTTKIGEKEKAEKLEAIPSYFQASRFPTPKVAIETAPTLPAKDKQEGLKVLLIEDNNIARHTGQYMLESAGFVVYSVADGEEALKFAKKKEFDLIVTDIGLPGIDGNEFVWLFRRWEMKTGKASLPIIGLSAHTSAETKKEAIEVGMNTLLAKPLNKQKIAEILSFLPPDQSASKETIHATILEEQPKNKPATVPDFARDLPQTTEGLFEMSQFPLLDAKIAIQSFGNEETLIDMLKLMIDESLPGDTEVMVAAYSKKDWDKVQKQAHKIKGGAVYVGTVRLKMACQYLERYWKSGQRELLEELYQQAIKVIQSTIEYVADWLIKQKRT
jgi:two-component system, OmpR family, aerobic respiration control sensor histidine kinase ArcB